MEEIFNNELPKNPIDKLLDENDSDNIILYDGENEPFEFEQIAVVPYKDEIYAIMRPTFEVEGMEDDEAIVFLIGGDEEESYLVTETNEEVIDEVFAAYYRLLDEAEGGE